MEVLGIIIVLIEGILSFFSPCIIPLLPIYLGILSTSDSEEKLFHKSGLFKNTIAFVLGISTTFILLGLSFQSLSSLLAKYQNTITLVGGIIIVIMGLFYMGVLKIPFLNQEKRMHIQTKRMNILSAYLFGFTFSFGWTPCIGPMLASVLMMSITQSFVLIVVYTMGFIIPFMIVALFYNRLLHVLTWIKCNMDKIKLVGGAVLIISGAVMIWGSMNVLNAESIENQTNTSEETSAEDGIKAIDFELKDQFGKIHQLSDYKGKIVYLTFWTTWCKNCVAELPILNQLYEEYGFNEDDVAILTIASPNVGREGDEEYIKSFIEQNGYTLPVLMDDGGMIASYYGIQAIPTNFVIKPDGTVFGYIPGRVGEETIRKLIEEVKE
ncbi:redoxin domain-containing protein [Turicibacter sanguinis]|uniref:redoxin domain-containing protein n=1 Tax=Turicibacter sanguinis TaxID=154288 RepID=UPI0012BB8861|nr:cytochrome c biogenesis protein CcdA [Turicibacter sanguinis]MDB8437885.1 redoxin domain-containing protein [Turicibacter sanguinis]MDB8565296.1 redoxin domain-containing protein [Turicibacter sanguinis]MDB8568048.1 redoxin domain-containing protein [Turicibacter sanguinis]MDB8570797.1 redoxin domain-containing protein [Turicibacter sanguinis]MDB8579556.1 redoxin domain-containing protein [Turicibacter sanguinis]